MRRGDVWSYTPVIQRPGQSLLRLIVSANAINDSGLPVVLSLLIGERDPDSLLAVRIGEHGWANAMTIEATIVRRLGEKVGEATAEEMESVNNALRAALDL